MTTIFVLSNSPLQIIVKHCYILSGIHDQNPQAEVLNTP